MHKIWHLKSSDF